MTAQIEKVGIDAGKIQPQAVPLEEAVLGALMLDKDALPVIIDFIEPESFYSDGHKEIYTAILDLYEKSKPIDLLTVNEQLTKNGTLHSSGGSLYLVELTNRIASTANIEYHARIIQQKKIQRDIIRFSYENLKAAYDDTTDVLQMCSDIQLKAFDLTHFAGGAVKSNAKLGLDLMKKVELAMQSKGKHLLGTPSGYRDMDTLTRGFRGGNLYIVAGRPGMGKTALVVDMAKNIAITHKMAVAVFSLEMSSEQLMARLISGDCGISTDKMESGKLESYEWQNLQSSIEKMMEVPIIIDDTPSINIFELRSKARRLKMEKDIQMVIVDYLQLMTVRNDSKNKGNREQEISSISRALKALSKELDVPVIALSQLSRAVETRGGTKRPQLSDLRESGAIEQDADMVTFVYRPEYYEIFEDDEGNSLRGVTELIVAKNRHGATTTVKLKFKAETTSFQDMNYHDDGFEQIEEPQNSIMITTPNTGDVPF